MKLSGNIKVLLLSDVNSSHTQRWAGELASRGLTVGIFSLTFPEHDWYSEKQIEVFNFKKLKSASLTNTSTVKINYLSSLTFLKKIIKEFSADIIHAHYASSYGFLGALSGKQPFVISVWGSDIYEFPSLNIFTKYILKYSLNKAKYITATSKHLGNKTKEYTRTPIEVIAFGIDTKKFSPLMVQKSRGKIIIGCIKSLEKIYAIDIVIKAFALCKKKLPNLDIKLQLVGSGTQENTLKNLVNELGLQGSVIFRGKVSYERIQEEYQQLDIFVNVSHFESFGVSVIEASSSGLSVIISDVGGLKEVGVKNETCLFVKPGNVEETADAMIQLIQDENLRKTLGENGRKFVLENYSIDVGTDKMLKLYASLFPALIK